METLKKIVSNQYFPAAAVLAAVVLFWAVGMLGGLSLLHNNQPPLTTLTWMLFVYLSAVLTPIAGLLAALIAIRSRSIVGGLLGVAPGIAGAAITGNPRRCRGCPEAGVQLALRPQRALNHGRTG